MKISEILARVFKRKVPQLEAGKEEVENTVSEPSAMSKAQEYRNRLAKEAQEIRPENMPEEEIFVTILRKIGMKDAIANSETAVKKVVELAKQKIVVWDIKCSEHLPYIERDLKEIIKDDGHINCRMYPDVNKTQEIDIDVNENGQVILDKKEDIMIQKKGISAWSKINDKTIIEDGIEMRKEYRRELVGVGIGVYANKTPVDYIIERNSDLVTAHVTLQDKGLASSGDEIEGQILLDGLNPCELSTMNGFETDIKEARKAIDEGKTPDGFMYEGNDRKLKKATKEQIKDIFNTNVKGSEKFRKLAVKKGLAKEKKEFFQE